MCVALLGGNTPCSSQSLKDLYESNPNIYASDLFNCSTYNKNDNDFHHNVCIFLNIFIIF